MRVAQNGKIYKLQHLLISMKVKKVMILFCCLFLAVLLIGSVSAFDFDNIKEFKEDDNYGTIEIYNSFLIPGVIKGDKLAEYSLVSNSWQCLIDCYAEGTATLYVDDTLFDEYDFEDKKGKKKFLDYNMYIEVEDREDITIPTFDDNCSKEVMANGTIEVCNRFQNGSYEEEKITYDWKKYKGEVLEAGDYKWRIEAKKDEKSSIDWAFGMMGISTDEVREHWAWWNNNWSNKKQIILTENSGSTLNNYSILLNVSYESSMLNDFDDLRFLDSTETTELGYWIESKTDGENATIWVKVPDLELSTTTNIYMYYNNPLANTASNIKLAFEIGDDFNDESVDASIWETQTGSIVESGGVVNLTGTATVLSSFRKNITEYELVYKSKYVGGSDYYGYTQVWNSTEILNTNGIYWTFGTNKILQYYNFVATPGPSQPTLNNGQYYFWSMRVNSTTHRTDYGTTSNIDTNLLPFNSVSILPNFNNIVSFISGSFPGPGISSIDYMYFRPLADIEPSYVFEAEEDGIGISATFSFPVDDFTTSNSTVELGCNFTGNGGTNISNVTVKVYDVLDNLDYENTDSTPAGLVNSYNKTWNTTSLTQDIYKWECFGLGDDLTFKNSGNRTFTVHTTTPGVIIHNPTGIIEILILGNNLTLNWTVTESGENLTEHITNCSYTYNDITTEIDLTICLETNQTSFTYVSGVNILSFEVTDVLNLMNSTITEWDILILEINQTFNNPVIELSFEDFELFVNASEVITQTLLNYNGTNYISNLLSLGGGIYQITTNIQVPAFDENVNVSFFYNITTTSTNDILLPSRLQEVRVLNVGNCTDFDNLIMNLSLFNERTLEDITGTIEFDLEILNEVDNSVLNKLSTIFSDIHNTEVCTDINLSMGNYVYDLELRYYSGNITSNVFSYVPEFYHIQKGNVANLPQTINLYDLNVNESTEFTIFYRDNNYVARENVLLQIQRKYVDEGIFRVIEIPITSSEGSAVGHFDLNNYKYKITVTLNGEVLNVFDNPSIRCESELSGICELRLKGLASVPSVEFVSDLVDFFYTVDQTNDSVIVDFSIPSGESSTVNIVMVQSSPFADDIVICNQSIVTSAGQVECDVVSSIGDSKVSIRIISAGNIKGILKATFQEDLNSNFLLNNYFIGAIMLMTLILMFISSPSLMVGASVFGVMFLGLIFILKASSVGLYLGAISWLIVVAIIILTKLNKKAEQ